MQQFLWVQTLFYFFVLPSKLFPESQLLFPEKQNDKNFFDKTVDKIVQVLDSKNISQHILDKIAHITPPIDATPGISSVTKLFELLPQDVKDTLAHTFPDTIDFPGTRLWEAVAQRWLEIQSKSTTLRNELEKAGFIDKARKSIQVIAT